MSDFHTDLITDFAEFLELLFFRTLHESGIIERPMEAFSLTQENRTNLFGTKGDDQIDVIQINLVNGF